MRILVIGPGALGIVTAVRLHKAGHDVEVVVRDEAKAMRLNDAGLVMTDTHGQDHHARVPCVWNPSSSGPYDLMIHTTKLHVAEEVLRTWLPSLAPNGWLVPFQNGVHGDAMRDIVGPQRFMEASVYWPATLVEEGVSQHIGDGTTVVGPWPHGAVESHHQDVASVLGAVTKSTTSHQMEGVKWSKLAINAAMTSCGVVTGKTLGEMIGHGPSRMAFLGVVRETMAVMKASGIKPVRVGPSKPDLLAKLPDWAGRMVLAGAAKKYGDSRSSSAQSMLRGEPTEVDYLNGLVAKVGRQRHVKTHVNNAVVETVHAIERGELTPGFDTVEGMMAPLMRSASLRLAGSWRQ